MRIRNYETVRKLAMSAHGHSYLVRDSDGREFVAKALPSLTDMSFEWAAERVAAAVSALGEASPVYSLERDESDVPVVLSRLRRGMTLGLAFQSNSLPEASARWQILAEVARLLGALHRHGVAHGDVSPDNIMLGRGGKVYLLDLELDPQAKGTPGFSEGVDDEVTGSAIRGEDIPTSVDIYAWVKLMHYLGLEAEGLAEADLTGRNLPDISALEMLANEQSLGIRAPGIPAVASLDVAAQLRAVSATALSPSREREINRDAKMRSRRERKADSSESSTGFLKRLGKFPAKMIDMLRLDRPIPGRQILLKKTVRLSLLLGLLLVAVTAGYLWVPAPAQTATWQSHLEGLVQARDEALVAGSEAGLRSVYAGSSAELEHDLEQLKTLRIKGQKINAAKTEITVNSVEKSQTEIVVKADIQQTRFEVCEADNSCRSYGPFPKRNTTVVLDADSLLVKSIKTGV